MKELTISKMQKLLMDKETSLFVINQTSNVERAPISFDIFTHNMTVSVVVEDSYAPQDLTEQAQAVDIISNPHFLNAVSLGLITIVDPDEARETLENAKEASKIEIPKEEVQENASQLVEGEMPDGVNPKVFFLVNNPDSESDISEELKNIAGENYEHLSPEDIDYLATKGIVLSTESTESDTESDNKETKNTKSSKKKTSGKHKHKNKKSKKSKK